MIKGKPEKDNPLESANIACIIIIIPKSKGDLDLVSLLNAPTCSISPFMQ